VVLANASSGIAGAIILGLGCAIGALGAPQWRVTLGVVLPAAASGIATGAMLAIARASGETAPLLLTVLGSRFFNLYLD
jgi:phosphate transport system permease protein